MSVGWVLAVDPGGKHVGWAEWRRRWSKVAAGEVAADCACEWFSTELHNATAAGDEGCVVIEEFRLYGGGTLASQVGSEMTTSELIGALKWIAGQASAPVRMQGANLKRGVYAQLRARGIQLIGKGPHARDAELHLRYYLLRNRVEL